MIALKQDPILGSVYQFGTDGLIGLKKTDKQKKSIKAASLRLNHKGFGNYKNTKHAHYKR